MVLETILENINPPQNRREQLRQIEGTPSFTERNPTISANGFWLLNFEDDYQYGKWTPLNLVVVDNQSASDLNILINQNDDQAVSLPSNNSKTIQREGIRRLKIVERSGNQVSKDDVEVTFTRQAVSTDELAREKKKTLLNLN